MTRTVSQMEYAEFVLPLTVGSIAGNQLEQSAIHLVPSLEVNPTIICT